LLTGENTSQSTDNNAVKDWFKDGDNENSTNGSVGENGPKATNETTAADAA
jgi:hypothetical protein